MRQRAICAMVGVVHLHQRAHRIGAAAGQLAGARLGDERLQHRARLVHETVVLALDVDDVGVLRDRPEGRIAFGLEPHDRRLAAHRGEERVQSRRIRVRLRIGDLGEFGDGRHGVNGEASCVRRRVSSRMRGRLGAARRRVRADVRRRFVMRRSP